MHDRIKELRKVLNLTQEAFGRRIGVKRNTIATYEFGRNKPIDSVVSLICREFNVNEDWLRYGTGEMFNERSRDDEIAAFFDDVLRDESDNFRKRLVSMLSKLDTSDWADLERIASKLVSDRASAEGESPLSKYAADQGAPPPVGGESPPHRRPATEEEKAWARAEAEAYYRELLLEKRAEAGFSPSDDPAAETRGA